MSNKIVWRKWIRMDRKMSVVDEWKEAMGWMVGSGWEEVDQEGINERVWMAGSG